MLVAGEEASLIGFPGVVPSPYGAVLVKRRFEPLAGRWSLPGGAIEVGETLEAGLAREIAEETGLVIEVGPVLDVFDRISLDSDRRVRYHYVLIDYLCRPRGGRLVAGSDVSEVTIADPAALEQYGLTVKATTVIGTALRVSEAEARTERLQYDGAP